MLLAFTQQHNSPADCARELFKPSKDAASLPVPIKKNWKFGSRFFAGDGISGIGLSFFG